MRKQCEQCLVRTGDSTLRASEVIVEDWRGPLDCAWDDVWASHFALRLRCTNRDAAYLNWRYVHHPSFCYSLHLARYGPRRPGRRAGRHAR